MHNIIQLKCHCLRANFNDFPLLCDNYNRNVCFLQETMLTKDDFIIRGFNCIYLTSRDIDSCACGVVWCQSWLEGIRYSECSLNTTVQAKSATISTSKIITMCSLYLPPSNNLNIVLLTRLIDQLSTPFVVCGDFNGHIMTWGCDKTIVGEIELIILLLIIMYDCLIMVLIHIYSQFQEHSQPLIFLCVLRTFLWRLILWLNQIHTVVIIFLHRCFAS